MRIPEGIRRCVPILLLLVAVTSGAEVMVSGGLTYEHEVAPGKTYEGSFTVQNPDKEPREVKVYQTDYLFYADGATYYGDPGTMPRSNTRWLTFTPKQFTVPGGEEVTIRYIVQVPNDARLAGTYWSLLMVEPVGPDSPESSLQTAKDRVSVGVRQVLRYAVQVVTHIGQTGTGKLKFAKVQLASTDGRRRLLVDAENTGERWLRGPLWVELYDGGGALVGRYDAIRLRIYPGTSVRYTVDLSGVMAGTYKALIVIDCGGDDVFGANLNLVLAP
jgi:hypothetical protein